MKSSISLRSKVYHTGMRYVQRAMMARSTGDMETAQKYMDKFRTLCDFIQSTGLDSVPETKNQATCDSIEKMNERKLVLLNNLQTVIRAKDKESLNRIKESVEKISKSCQIYSKCIEMNLKPPQTEEQSIQITSVVVNEDIPKTAIRVLIKNIGGISKKNITYNVKCYSISTEIAPKETPLFGAGPIDFTLDWNIVKRNNLKYMARLATKKSLAFELIMHEKGVLSTKTKTVGGTTVPLSLLAKQNSVSKTYTLEKTDETPDNEVFSLSLVLEASSPLISQQYDSIRIPFTVIKKGASYQPYENPMKKIREQEKVSSKVTPHQTPENASKSPPKKPGKKQMSELTKAEAVELTKRLPKVAGMPFHVMDDWELERWMSNNVLKHLLEETNQAIMAFESMGIETPEKLVKMHSAIKQKIVENANDLKTKKINAVQYLKKIMAQVQEDEKEAKARGLDTVPSKLLIHRAKIMREEYTTQLAALKKK